MIPNTSPFSPAEEHTLTRHQTHVCPQILNTVVFFKICRVNQEMCYKTDSSHMKDRLKGCCLTEHMLVGDWTSQGKELLHKHEGTRCSQTPARTGAESSSMPPVIRASIVQSFPVRCPSNHNPRAFIFLARFLRSCSADTGAEQSPCSHLSFPHNGLTMSTESIPPRPQTYPPEYVWAFCVGSVFSVPLFGM